MDIEIKNKSEILRIYENNRKNAKTDAEKVKLDNSIAKVKKEIEDLKKAQTK